MTCSLTNVVVADDVVLHHMRHLQAMPRFQQGIHHIAAEVPKMRAVDLVHAGEDGQEGLLDLGIPGRLPAAQTRMPALLPVRSRPHRTVAMVTLDMAN